MTNFVKTLAGLLLVLTFQSLASATPGDVKCTGLTATKQKVEVLKGFESADHDTPSTLVVTLNGKIVAAFPDGSVVGRYVNVGNVKNPFMNYQEQAEAGGNKVILRYPEQAQDGAIITTYITLEVPSQKLSIAEIELSCPQ